MRVFLEVGRRGSFRAASETLGLSLNALRRRIEELEQQLGTLLLTRHVDGVRMTVEGHDVLAAAKQMEEASFSLMRAKERARATLAGEVRIAVTEGLGTFWISPRLIEFQRAHPQLLVDLSCAMRSADVLRLEADISVQLTRPTAPDVKIVKLGRLHTMPFASESYIDTYGMPKNRVEMLKHRLVLQFADQTQMKDLFDKVFPDAQQLGFVAMRTNVSSANLWAVAKGAGIGWVPTYAHAIGANMIPVNVGLNFGFDIWLAYHNDAGRIRRVRRIIDWLIEAFDPAKFPWFRDEFIHPDELPRVYGGEPLINWFEGFTGRHADRDDP